MDPTQKIGEKNDYQYVFDLCPVNYVTPDARNLMSMYVLWKQGKMIDDGGVGRQPAKYVDAMMFLDSLWAKHEREIMATAGRK